MTPPHLLGQNCRSTLWRWWAQSREETWPPLRAPCAGLVGSVRRQPGGGRDDFVLLMVMSVVLLVVMFLLLLLVVMAMAKIFSPLGLAMGRRPRTFVQTLLWKENDFCAFSFWSKSIVVIWIFTLHLCTPLHTFIWPGSKLLSTYCSKKTNRICYTSIWRPLILPACSWLIWGLGYHQIPVIWNSWSNIFFDEKFDSLYWYDRIVRPAFAINNDILDLKMWYFQTDPPASPKQLHF